MLFEGFVGMNFPLLLPSSKLKMLAIKLTLFIVVASIYTLCVTASDENFEQVAVESENASDMQPDEEIVLEREKRSPWGGRRRRRWGGVRIRVRRVGKVIGKAAGKVVKAVKKIPTAVKKVVKKIPKEIKRVGKQAGSVVRRTVTKVRTAIRKTVHAIKKTARKVKEIPRNAGRALKKIRDKLKENVGKLLAKKEKEEEIIEEIPEPEAPQPPKPTEPPKPEPETSGPIVVTRPPCDDICQVVKEYSRDAEFFRQGYCAFYTVKRNHQDFFLDRNTNKTLGTWVRDVAAECLSLYISYGEEIKKLDAKLKFDNQQQLTQKCMQSAQQACLQSTANDNIDYFRMRCLKPCYGFSGCVAEDKNIVSLVQKGISIHDAKLNSAF